MKATGIARKVDDLGRITIPKEIRDAMHIYEEDKLEFYTEGKMIGLMKQVADEVSAYGELIGVTVHMQTGFPVAICDREKIVYATGVLKDRLTGQEITEQVIHVMQHIRENRDELVPAKAFRPVRGQPEQAIAMAPMLNNKLDFFGAIFLLKNTKGDVPDAGHLKVMQTAAAIIGGILDEPESQQDKKKKKKEK